MSDLTIQKVRAATRREKLDAGLPKNVDIDAVIDRGNRVIAYVASGRVLQVPPGIAWDGSEIESLLYVRANCPLTANHDLSDLPPTPRRPRPDTRGRIVHHRWTIFKFERTGR